MQQSSDTLFNLINSLSKAEKRYFKVFSGKEGSGSKGYLVLFDIMCGMKRYDKEALNKKIKEKNLLTNFLKTRQYLFDSIIKSLIFYYSENDNEFKTRLQLLQLLVLNKKELFGLAQKKLKIFERNCAKQNRTLLLAETYALMKSNAFNLFLNNYDNDSLQELMQKEEANLQLLMNESKFRSLMMKVLTLIKNENTKSSEAILKEYRKLESHPLLQEAEKAKTLRSRLIYLSLTGIIQFKLGKNEEALRSASSYLSMIEKNKHVLRRNTFYYLVGLRNKIIALRKLKRNKEVQSVLQKLREINCHNTNQELLKFRTYYTFSLLSLIDSDESEEAARIIPEIEKQLEHFSGIIDQNSALQMQLLMANVLFRKKDFDRAIIMLNRMLGEPQIKDFVSIFIPAKILLMLSHYELKNLNLMPSLARSIMRQMKMEGYEATFEYSFVRAFLDSSAIGEALNELSVQLLNDLNRTNKREAVIDFTFIQKFLKEKIAVDEEAFA